MMIPKKRVLLSIVLALVGLAATVAVARAAIPIITDTTAPPSGHSTAACTGCHVVTPTPIDLPGAGNGTTHDDTDSVEASDDDTDKASSEADHHDSGPKGHDGKDEQAHDAQDAVDKTAGKAHDAAEKAAEKAHEAAEHETVGEQVQERDHQDPQSVDQGGAQHDGSHHKAEGSSD